MSFFSIISSSLRLPPYPREEREESSCSYWQALLQSVMPPSSSSSSPSCSSSPSPSRSFSLSVFLLNLTQVLVFLLSMFGLRSAPTPPPSPAAVAVSSPTGAASCMSHDQPNPLATLYPNNATGVLNATVVILPIPLATARAAVPPQYGLLEHAWRALLPGFPEGMYPLMLQAGHDHDIQFAAFGLSIPDFSKAEYEFPFVDFLGDGHSSFRWVPYHLMEASNADALAGTRAYGAVAEPAAFDPPCDAFRQSSSGSGSGASPSPSHFFRAVAADDASLFAELDLAPLRPGDEASPYPLSFFRNVTNQPVFANGSTCDQQVRLFGTALSEGPFAPVHVRGRVAAHMPPLRAIGDGSSAGGWGGVGADGIYGLEIATPFVENNYLDCWSMQGYDGVDIPGY